MSISSKLFHFISFLLLSILYKAFATDLMKATQLQTSRSFLRTPKIDLEFVSVVASDESEERSIKPLGNSSISSKKKGLQIMITRKMRRRLIEDLGYLSSEVDEMEPQIASVVIDRSLSRPLKGMPDSWRRKDVGQRHLKDARNRFQTHLKELGSAIIGLAKNLIPIFPVILLGSALYLQRGSLIAISRIFSRSQQPEDKSGDVAFNDYSLYRSSRLTPVNSKLDTKSLGRVQRRSILDALGLRFAAWRKNSEW